MQYRMIMAASLAFGNFANAMPAPPHVTAAPKANLARRQQPDAAGSSVLDAPMTIAAGESFDGGNVVFDRGVSCTGQEEGGDSDAVFILEAGASLSNVIIGPNQVEGVHCNGGCTITNVWWDAVCEDAFSIKKQADGETTTINGGGAKGAEDKVIQHNGGGTVVIKDFTVSDFGKLYRSCGNCDDMPARHVEVSGVTASDGKILVGINPNMGDTASISGNTLTNVEDECIAFNGVTDGSEPEEVGPCENTSGSGSGSASTDAPAATSEAAVADLTSAAGESEAAPTTVQASEPAPSDTDDSDDNNEETDDNQEESGDDQEESNENEEESSDDEDNQ
ncbi:pectate lyase [Fusarium albosuccineum]|uniref:Pectate lyase n=1 Tax=Fusarium albosuccineum TaxID=1237068 RepID=A0A8H4NUK7_9HYPO|nr:pectate lyase [Fusarium albosuccineum]